MGQSSCFEVGLPISSVTVFHMPFVWAGQVVPCEDATGNMFDLDRLREVVSKMLSCDYLCALCTFLGPFCLFLPRAFEVQVGRVWSSCVMEPKETCSGGSGQVGLGCVRVVI